MEEILFVEVKSPLSLDEWQALADEIVEEGRALGAKGVALPAILPTSMGMADELSRSLVNHLRAHGFAIIGPIPGEPHPHG
jgi:hypothetical protein